MSGTQQQIGTGNGTRAGRPAMKAAGRKRTRRTKAQLAAAKQAQPAAAAALPTTGPVARAASDPMIAAFLQTDAICAKLTPAQLVAWDAYNDAKRLMRKAA